MELGFAYAIGAAVTWGLVYAIDQKILEGISPFALLFVSSVFGAFIMLPFVAFDDGSIKTLLTAGKGNLALIVVSAALATLASFLILASIKSLDAASASIIEISYPFFVVLFSFIIFRTVPNMAFYLGGALVFLGSFIIIKYAT